MSNVSWTHCSPSAQALNLIPRNAPERFTPLKKFNNHSQLTIVNDPQYPLGGKIVIFKGHLFKKRQESKETFRILDDELNACHATLEKMKTLNIAEFNVREYEAPINSTSRSIRLLAKAINQINNSELKNKVRAIQDEFQEILDTHIFQQLPNLHQESQDEIQEQHEYAENTLQNLKIKRQNLKAELDRLKVKEDNCQEALVKTKDLLKSINKEIAQKQVEFDAQLAKETDKYRQHAQAKWEAITVQAKQKANEIIVGHRNAKIINLTPSTKPTPLALLDVEVNVVIRCIRERKDGEQINENESGNKEESKDKDNNVAELYYSHKILSALSPVFQATFSFLDNESAAVQANQSIPTSRKGKEKLDIDAESSPSSSTSVTWKETKHTCQDGQKRHILDLSNPISNLKQEVETAHKPQNEEAKKELALTTATNVATYRAKIVETAIKYSIDKEETALEITDIPELLHFACEFDLADLKKECSNILEVEIYKLSKTNTKEYLDFIKEWFNATDIPSLQEFCAGQLFNLVIMPLINYPTEMQEIQQLLLQSTWSPAELHKYLFGTFILKNQSNRCAEFLIQWALAKYKDIEISDSPSSQASTSQKGKEKAQDTESSESKTVKSSLDCLFTPISDQNQRSLLSYLQLSEKEVDDLIKKFDLEKDYPDQIHQIYHKMHRIHSSPCFSKPYAFSEWGVSMVNLSFYLSKLNTKMIPNENYLPEFHSDPFNLYPAYGRQMVKCQAYLKWNSLSKNYEYGIDILERDFSKTVSVRASYKFFDPQTHTIQNSPVTSYELKPGMNSLPIASFNLKDVKASFIFDAKYSLGHNN